MARNRISRIDPSVARSLPSLARVVLADNAVSDVRVLLALRGCENLRALVLEGCPISRAQGYRAAVVGALPQLTVLDFRKVSNSEREVSWFF